IESIASAASVTADRATNSLIVTATPEELGQIGEIIDQLEKGGSEPRTARFYPLLGRDPVALSRALEESFTKATFSADSSGGGLFATATEGEHTELAKVVEELNAQPTRLPTLKSFTLKHASPQTVANSIEDAFGRRSSAGVSFNLETRSVFVVGSRDDLQVAQTLVEQIDVPARKDDSRRLRVFSLGGADGRSITNAIENLFPESSTVVDVRYDPLNEQLFVVGETEQLKLVEEMLEQLTPPQRQLEIVQLEATDPYSFKLAADAMFEDEPVNSAPSISIDSNQQRVMIRATEAQLASLRKLLQQMGETDSGSHSGNPARLRFIPVHRNSEKLLDEVRRLWPAAGGNSLEVIRPADKSNAPNNEEENENDMRSEKGGGNDATENEMPMAKLTSAQQVSPNETTAQSQAETPSEKRPNGSLTVDNTENASSSTAIDNDSSSTGIGSDETEVERPSIVLVIGEEQWTVASADTQALDRFQRLLDTLLSPRVEPFSTTGNYSVYLLRHAGADQVQELLSDLFRPERGRTSSVSDLMQRVKIVADSRINALIVSGNRQDRRTVEELLGVLDSEDLLDSLQQISPTTLALQSASADNVEAILRDVYRSQLSSGAGRRPVPIPEGVSSDVASLLQQLNAQSSGPLLTLSVDETSNSIIFRAPIELTSEIRSFVESLDQKSQQAPAKRVDLIRLQSTNTKSLQQALKILLAK
ncbi:MAG: secretin N-terminal domain-containing protein, partial [Aureliella sp.]